MSAAKIPPLRSIVDTEDDFIAVANLSRAMDLALLHMVTDEEVTPGDIEALCHLSHLIEPAARRLMNDFSALNSAGIFATLWGPGRKVEP